VLRLTVSVGLLAVLAWRTDWDRIRQAVAGMRFEYWLAAVAVYVFAQVVSALRWQMLARPMGFHESLGRFTSYYFIGMYFNLLLPTSVGGDVIRAWCLDGKTGRRLAAFSSVLIDRFSGLLILVALANVAVAACPLELPLPVVASVYGLGGGAVIGIVLLPWLARWTSRFYHARRLAEGVRFYFANRRLLFATAGLSVVVQVAGVFLVWLLGQAIGVSVPALYYAIFVPMVSLLTLLPVSLNGMGIREWSTVLFLGALGVDEGPGLCLAVLWFFVLTTAGLLGGVVYFFGSFPRPEVQPDHELIGSDPHQGRAGQPQAAA
jgi:uncharacterized membrane protein YbhN (UPF0104 family)